MDVTAQSTLRVAACVKQRSPICTVSWVDVAGWFAAAAVNQCFAFTLSFDFPAAASRGS